MLHHRVAISLLALGCGATPSPVVEPTSRETHQPVCEVLEHRANRSLANVDRRLGDTAPRWQVLRTCIPDGDSAWMLFPRSAHLEWVRPYENGLGSFDPNRAQARIDITYQLVYAAPGAWVVQEHPQTLQEHPLDALAQSVEVLGLSDIDGDGRAEIAVKRMTSGWESSSATFHLYTATETEVIPYPPASDLRIDELIDFDEDGRLDILTVGPWAAIICGMAPPDEGMPRTLHHAQPDGSFSTSSRLAADYLKTHCPTTPGALFDDNEYVRLRNVSCARAWGASVDEVQAQLRREWVEPGEEDLLCHYDLPAMLEWATIDPPVRLDQADP